MNESKPTWLVIEPISSGHHYTYLCEIVRGALARKFRVVVGVGDDHEGESLTERLGKEFSQGCSLIILRSPLFTHRKAKYASIGVIFRAFRWWLFFFRTLRAAQKITKIDFVFVPYLDNVLFAIGLLGSPFRGVPFGGISMTQRFHLESVGIKCARVRGRKIKEALFRLALRARLLRVIFVIDETLLAYFEAHALAGLDKLRFIPDPADPAEPAVPGEARVSLGLPADRTILLVYGKLDSRKGIEELLSWLASTDTEVFLGVLLAGVMSPKTRLLIESEPAVKLRKQNRLWVIDRYLELTEEIAVFSAADIVWVAYPGVDLMSGIVVKAAQFDRKVISRNQGLIGRFTERYGLEVSSSSTRSLGIHQLPRETRLWSFDKRRPIPDHSWKNACASIFGS